MHDATVGHARLPFRGAASAVAACYSEAMVSLRTTRTILARALLGGALLLPAAAVLVPSDAAASVSITVGYDQLLKDADVVAIVSTGSAKSVWEDGRIYTYTELHVDQPVAGDANTGSTGWVRTMGGVVGEIGQLVDGEAVFNKDQNSLLFLRKFNANGVFEVSARGQGQYPVIIDPQTKLRKVVRSHSAGLLLPPRETPPTTPEVTKTAPAAAAVKIRFAHEVMHDRPVDDVTRELVGAWKRLHPAPAAATK